MTGLTDIAIGSGLTIDPNLFEARFDGELIQLTATEFDLLDVLSRERDRVVPREELRDRVWGAGDAGIRVVDTFISRLRTKLRSAGHPGITSVRKRGYRLRAAADQSA